MFNYEFPPIGGGTGIACRQLLREFERQPDLSIDLLTSGLGATPLVERLGERIRVCRLPVGKRDEQFWRAAEIARWTASALRRSRRLVAEGHYDLCHAWAGWPSGIPAHALRGKLPYLIALRGSDVPGYSRRLALLDATVLRPALRRIWSGASAVISVSDPLRTLAHETSPELPIEVIPNGVDTEFFHPGGDVDGSTILCVGRLIERKGVADLLHAFSDLARKRPDARLSIAGTGPERERLEAIAKATIGADRVEFLGHLDRDELAAAYRRAALFALPSRSEGMPNAVLEAMASGLPIVATPAAAAGIVRENGIIVEANRPKAIADALDRYLSDAELRGRHAARSREIATEMSWSATAESYRALYERTLERTPTPG